MAQESNIFVWYQEGKIYCYSWKHIWPNTGYKSIKQARSHSYVHMYIYTYVHVVHFAELLIAYNDSKPNPFQFWWLFGQRLAAEKSPLPMADSWASVLTAVTSSVTAGKGMISGWTSAKILRDLGCGSAECLNMFFILRN